MARRVPGSIRSQLPAPRAATRLSLLSGYEQGHYLTALVNADPANATCAINLSGQSMGQLRTANNRRNRVAHNTTGRTRAATEILAGGTVIAPTPKSKRTAS